jgi:hypothetical protein
VVRTDVLRRCFLRGAADRFPLRLVVLAQRRLGARPHLWPSLAVVGWERALGLLVRQRSEGTSFRT